MPDRLRTAACLVSAALCAGCVPAASLPYRPAEPVTVSLPLALSGVRDARWAFARLFATELDVTGNAQQTPWLHGIEPHPQSLPLPSDLAAAFAARAGTTSVLIVNGLFGDCLGAQSVPFGDGAMRSPERSPVEAYRQYEDLGLRDIRLAPLPGRASAESNGRRLAEVIRAESARSDVQRVVVVAYSKGVPDMLHALAMLQREGGVPSKFSALVSVAGVVMGTPLAAEYEQTYDALSPQVDPFDCTPSQGGELASLTRRERVAWLAANPPPSGPAYYSIVAHAPVGETAPALRFTARQLAAVDPRNDGQVIAADAVLPNSTLLAEARADHWDVALPRDRHPSAMLRALSSGRRFPREALLRATLKWVIATAP